MPFCVKCGNEYEAGSKFCIKCGANINDSENVNAGKVNYNDYSTYSTASGAEGLKYVVLQVTLKEKFLGTGSGNLTSLENAINEQAAKGYRLHTITTASASSSGFLGGDRIQATLVFEKIV